MRFKVWLDLGEKKDAGSIRKQWNAVWTAAERNSYEERERTAFVPSICIC